MGASTNEITGKLLKAAEQLGGVCEGLDGRNHYVVRFANGERARIAATPSAYSTYRNTLTDLQKISGRRLPKVQRNRSRKSFARSNSRPTAAERERSAEVGELLADLHAEAEQLQTEWDVLTANPSRDGVQRARDILAAWADMNERRAELYQPPLPPLGGVA